MANRKKTPDILGDLLGGNNLVAPESPAKTVTSKTKHKAHPAGQPKTSTSDQQTGKPAESDAEYFETLLDRAASALELVAEVLGRRRLVRWLDEMKEAFSTEESASDRKIPSATFRQNCASWATNHLGAESTTMRYLANGLSSGEPYEVDIWAHFKGEGSQNDLDIWIECVDSEPSIKRKHILKLVDKATDVFHAAHTEKQEFWFDRLMLVSTSPFDASALELAEQEGVVCILYDGTSYVFQSEGNWKLKPKWFREAQAGKGLT